MKIKNNLFFLLSIILIYFINISICVIDPGSRCETIDSKSPCIQYLNYSSIYLPTGVTQEIITTQLTSTLNFLSIIQEPDCKSNATALYCLYSYKECNNETILTPNFPLPSYPFRKNCDLTMSLCSAYAAYFPISCSSYEWDNSTLSFPETSTIYNLTIFGGSSSDVIECNNPVIAENATEPSVYCVPPLIAIDQDVINSKRKYQVAYGNCVLPCPLSVFTDEQYKTKFYSEATLFSVSCACCIYLILTFGIFPNKLSHRNLCIVYLGITVLFLCASYAVQEARYGGGDWRCTSDIGRYKSSEDGTCILGGFFFQIGGLGTIFMISLYSFDFFLTIHMKTNKYFLQTSIVIWALTFFYALLPIKHYESSIASAGCWISDENNMFWQYFCFYVPSYLFTVVLAFCIISSVYKVFKMTLIFKSINDKRILILNLRNIAFLIAILFCVTFSSMYPLFVSYNSESFTKTVEVWVTCLFEKGEANCPRVVFPQFDLRLMNALTMALIGILGFLGFGLDPHVYQIYKESIRFNYLLNLVGIQWCTPPTPPNSKQSASSTDSSSNPKEKSFLSSSGNNNNNSSRKSRGVSVLMKKVNTSPSTDNLNNSNSNDNLSQNQQQQQHADNNNSIISVTADNNNNNNNNNKTDEV